MAGAKKARSGGREGPASAPAEKASGRGKTAKPAAKPKAAAAAKPKAQPKAQAGKKTIQINRAPVLTAWAAVVAQRQGYRQELQTHLCTLRCCCCNLRPPRRPCRSWDAALTFGRAVSGIMAQVCNAWEGRHMA